MAYSSGGLIEATDYNNFAANVNTIWGAGSGSNGYGQTTTLSNVSATGTVAASNWATLIARLDSIRGHQSNTTSGITQPSAGNTVTFLSTLNGLVTPPSGTIFANKLAVAARGTALATALGNPALTNSTTWVTSSTKEFSITFSSTDTVRYYFNAGGLLTFYLSLTSGGTTKATDWASFLTNQVGTITLGSNFCSRTGTGGDNLTQNTSTGYWNLTTTYQNLFVIGSTSATADYGNNSITIQAKLGATANVVVFNVVLTDTAGDSFNDSITGAVNVFVGYQPPSTTYLANVWGTPGNAVSVTNTQS